MNETRTSKHRDNLRAEVECQGFESEQTAR